MGTPLLSIIAAFHDMPREAPRTLQTLSPGYQRGTNPNDYEVIAVDVGSDPPLDEGCLAAAGAACRLMRFPRCSSPAAAINAAVAATAADRVMVCIDGARMLSPGIVRLAIAALAAYPDRLVATVSWHLGPKVQNESMLEGYDQGEEDRLLGSIDWRQDGYRLFAISCLAQSSREGWLGSISESNCMAMGRQAWQRLGGYEERFTSPGGGLVNPDFYRRACDLLGPPVLLLGEGTFHQIHGGVATNTPRSTRPVRPFLAEYESLRGEPFAGPRQPAVLFGGMSAAALPWLADSLGHRQAAAGPPAAGTIAGSAMQTQPPSSSPADAREQRVVAILGMHRSGTSLLAGTFQECGLDLGEVSTSSPANEKGNRESWLLTALHEDLFREAGGRWNRPPERPVVWKPLHRAARDLFIRSFAESLAWGFKDPRLLFCIDGWLEALPRLQTVGVFRHPLEVARSLEERTPVRFNLKKALALWLAYNRRLIEWQAATGCPLLEYGGGGRDFNEQAAAVARQLDLPRTPAASDLTFFEARLRHQRADETSLPDEVAAVYRQLRDRSVGTGE